MAYRIIVFQLCIRVSVLDETFITIKYFQLKTLLQIKNAVLHDKMLTAL